MAERILSNGEEEIKLNASVVEYSEVTEENVGTFHFHVTRESFPSPPRSWCPATKKRGRFW